MKRACVDQSACIGCGLCAGTAPDVFRMNDAGVAEAYAEITAANRADAEAAVDGCPVSAIRAEE